MFSNREIRKQLLQSEVKLLPIVTVSRILMMMRMREGVVVNHSASSGQR